MIKFWDMDSNELFRATDADGDLPVSSLFGHLLFRERSILTDINLGMEEKRKN